MSKENIKQSIFKLLSKIAPEVDPDTIDLTAPIPEEFEIDSLDFLRLVVDLHDEYGIDIPEADYQSVITIEKMMAYIEERS